MKLLFYIFGNLNRIFRCKKKEMFLDESDFEGSEVLEALAAQGLVEDFFDAVDSDDFSSIKSLMKRAQLNQETIQWVLQKIEEVE